MFNTFNFMAINRCCILGGPYYLIEASLDTKWGGACPFDSDIYEQGLVPGRNLCSEQLTKYRNDMITEISNYAMS